MTALRRQATAPPIRSVHLGLGSFFRAHQAWYTDRAPDADEWGIAAFAGRSAALAETLEAQDGLYTLVTRAADGDRFELVRSVARAHAAADHPAWLRYLASPAVEVVTLTVTEAGYVRDPRGRLDVEQPAVRADIDALRTDAAAVVHTAPAKLVAGLLARRRADAGPLTIVACDNLPDNGAVVGGVVHELAERVDPGLVDWLEQHVTTVTTMVDRITPRTTDDDIRTVRDVTGLADHAPVLTEPFSEWVLSGAFAAARPRWEAAGGTFTDDIAPFEQRKLWLLNGGHSLLAYAGSIRGHVTVAEAVADDTCRQWLDQWWAESSPHLTQPPSLVAAYREALVERFSNPRMQHRLAQIAADGSQKVPVRFLPTIRRELAAGRVPVGASRAVAAWVCHLRGLGAPVSDVRADALGPAVAGAMGTAVRNVLHLLDPALAAEDSLLTAVVSAAEELGAS